MNRREYLCGGALLTCKRGNDLPHAKLNAEKVKLIREAHKCGTALKTIANNFSLHQRTIEKVVYFHTWKHVP